MTEVPAEQTAQVAEQPAGTPNTSQLGAPIVQEPAPEQPMATGGFISPPPPADPEPQHEAVPPPMASASNESPTLPPSAAVAAAKAHAYYGHIIQIAQQAQAEIQRYVPPSVLQAAETEAFAFIRSIL